MKFQQLNNFFLTDMYKLVKLVFLVKLYAFVFAENEDCFDCCDDQTILLGRAELCLENAWCNDGIWGDADGMLRLNLRDTHWENATYVRIFPNGVSESFRRCSVRNFEKLRAVYADTKGIKSVEIYAFWNLKNLETIHMSYNQIAEVQFGVFSYLPVKLLDLSWNKIGYVARNAFEGMDNLEILNLSYNEITKLNLRKYVLPLKQVLASNNFLSNVKLNQQLNISIMDFSFNRLTYFKLDENKKYELVDLTNNLIGKIDMGKCEIDSLRIALNNLTDNAPLLQNGTIIRALSLYPNLWNCSGLEVLLQTLSKRNIKILTPEEDDRLSFNINDYPVCSNVNSAAYEEYRNIRQSFIKTKAANCKNDNHCPSFMVCGNERCLEPCKYNACRSETKLCETKNHKFSCKCRDGYLLHPYVSSPDCVIPCFMDANCPKGQRCSTSLKYCV